jgi:DNA-directed RNA polymerase specialized sigma24 family protein
MDLLRSARSADREDALMDTILRVLESEVEGHIVGAELKSELARRYALRALQNQLIAQWRTRRRLEPLHDNIAKPPETTYEFGEFEKSILAELQRELQPSDRALLAAYLQDRETFRTEFERQGISPGAARVRVHRVLKRLRERGRGLSPVRE